MLPESRGTSGRHLGNQIVFFLSCFRSCDPTKAAGWVLLLHRSNNYNVIATRKSSNLSAVKTVISFASKSFKQHAVQKCTCCKFAVRSAASSISMHRGRPKNQSGAQHSASTYGNRVLVGDAMPLVNGASFAPKPPHPANCRQKGGQQCQATRCPVSQRAQVAGLPTPLTKSRPCALKPVVQRCTLGRLADGTLQLGRCVKALPLEKGSMC